MYVKKAGQDRAGVVNNTWDRVGEVGRTERCGCGEQYKTEYGQSGYDEWDWTGRVPLCGQNRAAVSFVCF